MKVYIRDKQLHLSVEGRGGVAIPVPGQRLEKLKRLFAVDKPENKPPAPAPKKKAKKKAAKKVSPVEPPEAA